MLSQLLLRWAAAAGALLHAQIPPSRGGVLDDAGIAAQQQFRADLQKRGTTATGGSVEDLRRKLQFEVEKWTRVVKVAGIKPE
ncbi:MAG: hypothetical protein ACKVQK_21555 [Burkholderiales bacterium]